MNFSRELAKLYRDKREFKDFALRDSSSPFAFLGREFAQEHDINGHKVLGVIVNDSRNIELDDDSDNNSEGVMRSQIILYCKKSDISGFKRDLAVRVNGRLFVIKEFHELQGLLWRIVLEENE